MLALIEKIRYLIVGTFFFCFLITGLLIFKDYGAHNDEYNNQHFGERWTEYIQDVLKTNSLTQPISSHIHHFDLIHGPFLEINLTLLKNSLKLTDSHDIILLRHLSIFFLFFLGTIIFYFFCQWYFQNWKLALVGTIFLILNPRLFTHAFFNTVDIGLLVFFTLTMFTLFIFLKNKTWDKAALHALTCAWATDIRIIGGLVVFFTISSMLVEIFYEKGQQRLKNLRLLLFYLLLFTFFFILFCPLLWSNPCANTLMMCKATLTPIAHNPILYLGKLIPLNLLPWHYGPVMILVSTPIMCLFLFFIGCMSAPATFLRNNFTTKRNLILVILWFFIPLLISKGKIYNSWRHLFFIYPAFVIIAISGLQYIWKGAKNALPKTISILIKSTITLLLFINLSSVIIFMIKSHPFEWSYLNLLAGENSEKAKESFELCNCELSYKQALEYILKTDHSADIAIKFFTIKAGINNLSYLLKPDRKRFVLVNNVSKAKYFIVDYKFPITWPYRHEYYSIKVNGIKILSVFQMDT